MARWTFYDGVTNQSYEFEINPNEGGTPTRAKNIQMQSTAAPDGKTLLFEGRDQPQSLDFSGKVLTQAHHDAMVTWFSKRNQILLTDDLGRQMYIYIISFDAKRERAAHYPWKHSYSVKAIIVSWAT